MWQCKHFWGRAEENLTLTLSNIPYGTLSTHLLSPLVNCKSYFRSCVERSLGSGPADESTCCRERWQHLYADVHKQDRELSLTHTPLTWISECFLSLKPTRVPGVMNVVTRLLSTGNTRDSRGCRLCFWLCQWNFCEADVGVLTLKR